jgi:hypothetical protein
MSVWQPQSEKWSKTPRTEQLTQYLEKEIGRAMITAVMDRYLRENPHGEQITLECLKVVGEARLRRIAEQNARAKGQDPEMVFDRVKQHFGLWIAIVASEYYGRGNVSTYRRRPNGPSSPRSVPDLWKPELSWVTAYTPHRITLTR